MCCLFLIAFKEKCEKDVKNKLSPISFCLKYIAVHTMVQSWGIINPLDLINTEYSGIN